MIGLIALLLIGGAAYFGWRVVGPAAADTAVRASGTIEADDIAISAETGGRVAALLVDEGDPVRAGQPVVQIDDALLQLQYRQASGPDLQRLELQIDRARVKAPADGRIGARSVRVGEVVAAGQTLFTLTPLSELRLTLYVLLRDLGRVVLGQAVRLTSDPYPNETFTGRVVWLANRAEFTPRNIQTAKDRANLVYAVRVAVPNPGERLKPGMPVDAVFVEVAEAPLISAAGR